MRTMVLFMVTVLITAVLSGCGSGAGTPPMDTTDLPEDSAGTNMAKEGGSTGNKAAERAKPDPLHPRVVLQTSMGEITLELDAKTAPATVLNFLDYVNRGHFDQTVFHYVDADKMILGGGFTSDHKEKPASVPIRNEAHNGTKNKRGTIAMARQADSIDSATSQFFINLSDNPSLDHSDTTAEEYGYCVFGKVVDGLAVVESISQTPTHDLDGFPNTPAMAAMVDSARVLR